MGNRAVICLGSNVDKERNLPLAVQLLQRLCHVVAVSSVYETAPVGGGDQPIFFNAALLLETELDAHALKQQVLARVEKRLKRVRTDDKNAPRTIDADLTLYNNESFDLDPDRHIPDPDLLRFAHVAVPVAELLPDEVHPETGEPFNQLAARLVRQDAEAGRPGLRKRSDIHMSGSPS